MRKSLLALTALAAALAGGAARIVQDQCGPFTDVSPGFCPYVLELYYLGITVGTSATTFSPDDPLTRGQGAAFIAKGLNQSLARSSRRAALGQWWTTTPHWDLGLGLVSVGLEPALLDSDGVDLWVPNFSDGTVSRVRQSDGKVLETWTGAPHAYATLVAAGRIFITEDTTEAQTPGSLYMIDPSQPAGDVTTVAGPLGVVPLGLTFDGSRIWTANWGNGTGGGVSIITPGATMPWSVTTITSGFVAPQAVIFDGSHIWVVDTVAAQLKKLDSSGTVLQSVPVGAFPLNPTFDGANIWVPAFDDDSVTVVRAADGAVVAILVGNGLDQPFAAGFDGQRILVTSPNANHISLFRAADLTALGFFDTAGADTPYGVCSDGVDFWISFINSGTIGRY